jgi:hypothetical protein
MTALTTAIPVFYILYELQPTDCHGIGVFDEPGIGYCARDKYQNEGGPDLAQCVALIRKATSERVNENLATIEDFCSRLAVLSYGAKAAQHYGAIRWYP